jgi:ADP-ribosyl-[dinitrogen reductase] hydrolase
MPEARTSLSHPLRIDEIKLPNGGRIGITFAPGKKQRGAETGDWDRDLSEDLDAIAEWNAAAVITLLLPEELHELGIAELGAEVKRRHMLWFHWPIRDGGVPDALFEKPWREQAAKVEALLKEGCKVVVHCKGGLGRAGMIAARLLVNLGTRPLEAILAVRQARAGTIETKAQEKWVSGMGSSLFCSGD